MTDMTNINRVGDEIVSTDPNRIADRKIKVMLCPSDPY